MAVVVAVAAASMAAERVESMEYTVGSAMAAMAARKPKQGSEVWTVGCSSQTVGDSDKEMVQPLLDHSALGYLGYVVRYYSSKRQLDRAQKDHLTRELDWVELGSTPDVGEKLAEKAPSGDNLQGLSTEQAQKGVETANYPLFVVFADIGRLSRSNCACRSFHTGFVRLLGSAEGHKYVRLVSYCNLTVDPQCRSFPLVQSLR